MIMHVAHSALRMTHVLNINSATLVTVEDGTDAKSCSAKRAHGSWVFKEAFYLTFKFPSPVGVERPPQTK